MGSLYNFANQDIDLLASSFNGNLNFNTKFEYEYVNQENKLRSLNKKHFLITPEDYKIQLTKKRLELEFSLSEFNNYRPSPVEINASKNSVDMKFVISDYASTKIIEGLWASYYKVNRDFVLTNEYENLPFVSKSLGANLLVLTSDGYILTTKRSSKTRSFPNSYHVSTSEGTSLLDSFGTHIDVANIFVRSAREELGIELEKKDIKINSLFLHLNTYQHGLGGFVNLGKYGITSKELTDLKEAAPDGWEHEELVFTPVEDINKLLAQENKFVPFGYMALVLSLENISPELKQLQDDILFTHIVKN